MVNVKCEYMRPDYRVFLPAKLFTIHILLFTDILFHVEHWLHRNTGGALFHVEHQRTNRDPLSKQDARCFTWNHVPFSAAI
jgi:hypothetical protein